MLDDPEQFDDEQFDCEQPAEEQLAQPRPVDRFRSTAAGTVLAAGLLGIADALEGPRDNDVEIVIDYAGDPPFSDRFLMRLDPDNPSDSIVVVQAEVNPRTSD